MLTRPDDGARLVAQARGAAVPGPRRAAHLPRPAGRRRRAAGPPGARGLPTRPAAVHRHLAPRCPARAADDRAARRSSPGSPRTLFGTDGHARSTSSARRWSGPPDEHPDRRARASGCGDPAAPRAYDASWSTDPLARWIETTFGLEREEGTAGWSGARPAEHREAAAELAELTGVGHRPLCARRSGAPSRPGRRRGHPVTGRPLFAFRLHQFLSKGDTVYVTLEDPQHPAPHPQLPAGAPGIGRQDPAAAGVLPRVRPGVPDGLARPPTGAVRYRSAPRHQRHRGARLEDGYLYVDLRATPGQARSQDAIDRPAAARESGWRSTTAADEVVSDSYRKRLPGRGHRGPLRRTRGAASCGRRSSRRRSCSACTAGSATSRCGARTSPSWPRSTRKAAPRRPRWSRHRSCARSARSRRSALDKKARKLLTFVDNRSDNNLSG